MVVSGGAVREPPPLPVDALMAAYDLGSWGSIQLLPGGKSQHFFVATSRGEYVVRRSYRSKTLAEVQFEHELMAYLRRHGFPAPEIVPLADGGTYVAVEGHLYRVTAFVKGSPYQAGNVKQLQAVARALATYHQLAASFRPSVPQPQEPPLHESFGGRLAAMPSGETVAGRLVVAGGDQDSRRRYLLDSLADILAASEAVRDALDRLYPNLPLLVIHGGCRRGSTMFAGDSLLTMLDFDSARLEARVLDVAIALHDFAKVYGDPGSPAYKVPLDLDVVSAFLNAYLEVNSLEPAEIEALPALLATRRLKRALGKLGDESVSPSDIRKATEEVARVRWLEANRQELAAALALVPGRAAADPQLAGRLAGAAA